MPGNGSLLYVLFSFLVMIGVFYLHTYILYPFIDKKHGKWYYAAFLTICLVCYMIIQDYLMPDIVQMQHHFKDMGFKGEPPPPPPPGPFAINLFSFVLIIFISCCYRLYIDKVQQDIAIKEKEAIHFKTELDFLRSQINPHFMFNLMNTLVLMARKKSDLLEPSLITLSQLMRGILYESDSGTISLQKEVKYLKNYIKLQLLRFGDNLRFNLFLTGDFEGFRIEPMLLIPFVENAFKHGTSMIQNPIIDVAVKLDNDKRTLILMVMNSTQQSQQTAERHSGIGLANVKRRLELLYPGKHQIQIERNDNEFRLHLEINL